MKPNHICPFLKVKLRLESSVEWFPLNFIFKLSGNMYKLKTFSFSHLYANYNAGPQFL